MYFNSKILYYLHHLQFFLERGVSVSQLFRYTKVRLLNIFLNNFIGYTPCQYSKFGLPDFQTLQKFFNSSFSKNIPDFKESQG